MSSVAQKEFVALQKKKKKEAIKRGIKVYETHFGTQEGKGKYELALRLMGQNSRPD